MYEDIINLPHYQSATRPHMSIYDRAAQFSPFAALTGYEDAVKETARLTDKKIELNEEAKSKINDKLQYIIDNLYSLGEITVTHFVADTKKSGGAYLDFSGSVRRIDTVRRCIIFTDKTEIFIDDILEITE